MSYLDTLASRMEIPQAEILEYLGEKDQECHVVSLDSFREELKKNLLNPDTEHGLKLESFKTHDTFRARSGEFTVESGKQGCGKSARHFLRAMCFAIQGQNSCIASLEMKPVETLKRGLFQFCGNTEPTEEMVDLFCDTFLDRIRLFTKVGTQTADKILALVRWCAANNLHHVFIDSIMKCSVKSGDINEVEDFANQLQGLAKDLNIHIWLIAHQTKGGEGVSKEDGVRGSGMLLDLADNFIYYEKNMRKAEIKSMLSQGASEKDLKASDAEILKQPDFFMEFRKQRHSTITLPRKFGFYGHDSMQFLSHETATRMTPEDWINGRFL